MLKNTKVRQVNLNTETGSCRILMDNGERFWGNDIYYLSDFVEYIEMLMEEDDMFFSDSTEWILNTRDFWEDWQDAYAKLGAKEVFFLDRSEEKRRIILKG